jgi:LuxR family transcriptional regulator, maltose regulon positive regulatory protein
VVAPALGRAVAACTVPFILVLDDTHLLGAGPAWDLVDALADNLPATSTLVVAGRARPGLATGRLRLEPGLVHLTGEQLALDGPAASELFESMGLRLGDDDVARLVDRTEGWPVGLRLVGLAIADGGIQATEPLGQIGCDEYVADYLRREWLGRLTPDEAAFIQQLSCFDWFSAELCDTVLQRSDSARRLDELLRGALLVIPLDRRGESFRLHHLLVEMLQQQLRQTDPLALRSVHARASTWFEAAGDLDRAFEHAMAGGDSERGEALVLRHAPVLQTHGRHATVLRWLGRLPTDRVHSSAALCVAGAMVLIGIGDGPGAIRWLRSAQLALAADPRPDLQVSLHVATTRAMVEVAPVADLLGEAERAQRQLAAGPWRAAACLVSGALRFLLGDDDQAIAAFEAGVAEARASGSPTVESLNQAHLAMVLFERNDGDRAGRLAREARERVREHRLEHVSSTMIVAAAAAMAEVRGGRADRAREEIRQARLHLASYESVTPWANLTVRTTLARACLQLGDQAGASIFLKEAEHYLELVPDAVRSKDQVAEITSLLKRAHHLLPYGPSGLTTAEMRVLQFFPTNMSLAAIAERLYVSRNTVKAQSVAIYRKLGVNSRAQAVERAREAGLLSR